MMGLRFEYEWHLWLSMQDPDVQRSHYQNNAGIVCQLGKEMIWMKMQIPVRQLWNFKAFSRRKDLSQMLHLYLYSWSGYLKHNQMQH